MYHHETNQALTTAGRIVWLLGVTGSAFALVDRSTGFQHVTKWCETKESTFLSQEGEVPRRDGTAASLFPEADVAHIF